MRNKVEAAAKMLEITTEELFVRAHREFNGMMFGLREPKEVHRRWRDGICTEPIYVANFVNRLVSTIH